MIQFRRGSTTNWRTKANKASTKLASGQPGYDKTKHKIKVGDGTTSWYDLPYASGLHAEEILDSEEKAKERLDKDVLLNKTLGLDDKKPEDFTIITYGKEDPDEDTVGQLYLQYYDDEPEADYVVHYGATGIWTYQQWHSGKAICWGAVTIDTTLKEAFEKITLCSDDNIMQPINYPFKFKQVPKEVASLTSSNVIAWLAGRTANSTAQTGTYNIISVDEPAHSAACTITLMVEGFWR